MSRSPDELTDPAPSASPHAGSPGTPAAPRFAVVDALRLVAALAVVAFHFLGPTDPAIWGESPKVFAYPAHHAAMYGWLGVEAFFLISGFVICMSGWGRTPGQFAVSRISRLFPAYWFVIALIVARIALVPMQTQDVASVLHPRVVLANLTMFPGPLHVGLLDGVAWTLDVEARFYLLMAVVLAVGTTYRRMLAFCTVWLVAAFVTQQTHNTLLDQFVLSDYTGLFVAGIAVYLMHRFGRNLLLWTLLGTAWGYQLTVLQNRVDIHLADTGTTRTVSWSLCAIFLTGFLAVLMLAALGPLARVRQRWLVTAGSLTYPLYLVHQSLGIPLGTELTRHVPELGTWGTMGLTLAAMLVLSWLVQRYVEKPLGTAMRRRLTDGLQLATPRGPVR